MKENTMRIITEQGRTHDFSEPMALREIFKDEKMESPDFLVAARMNFNAVSLNAIPENNARISPITMHSVEGRRIYQKSLVLVLFKAFHDLYPGKRIRSLHSVSKGIYHDTNIDRALGTEDIAALKNRMSEIISDDIPFTEDTMSTMEALEYFNNTHLKDKVDLLKTISAESIPIIRLGEIVDLRFIPAVPSSGYLKVFDLVLHDMGMILRFPRTTDPGKLPDYTTQSGLFKIFSENRSWTDVLEVGNTGELNRAVQAGKEGEIIKLAEALHEKKIAWIADEISRNRKKIKFILIAGPSSSGKTTFSKRLAIQLRVNAVKTEQISTDDYFKIREQTPRDEEGNYNFEDLDALDLDLFNKHLQAILHGKPVEIPNFSFELGRAKDTGKKITIPEDMPVIIEGIHCLNPELTRTIPRENKYFIYVSALTQLNIDDYNRIPTTDNRILRRIVRDSYFRGYSAYETISRWPSVRRGEDKNIFPYQDESDAMFNSALIYELGVLRDLALPLLRRVPPTVPEYSEARRLMSFIGTFQSIQKSEIPPTSLLREFIGESSFNY